MNEEFQPESEDLELESRLIAWMLGEASDFESEQIAGLVRDNPALAARHIELQQVHQYLLDIGAGELASDVSDWQLSTERRERLLNVIDEKPPTASQELPKLSGWFDNLLKTPVLALGVAASLLIVFILNQSLLLSSKTGASLAVELYDRTASMPARGELYGVWGGSSTTFSVETAQATPSAAATVSEGVVNQEAVLAMGEVAGGEGFQREWDVKDLGFNRWEKFESVPADAEQNNLFFNQNFGRLDSNTKAAENISGMMDGFDRSTSGLALADDLSDLESSLQSESAARRASQLNANSLDKSLAKKKGFSEELASQTGKSDGENPAVSLSDWSDRQPGIPESAVVERRSESIELPTIPDHLSFAYREKRSEIALTSPGENGNGTSLHIFSAPDQSSSERFGEELAVGESQASSEPSGVTEEFERQRVGGRSPTEPPQSIDFFIAPTMDANIAGKPLDTEEFKELGEENTPNIGGMVDNNWARSNARKQLADGLGNSAGENWALQTPQITFEVDESQQLAAGTLLLGSLEADSKSIQSSDFGKDKSIGGLSAIPQSPAQDQAEPLAQALAGGFEKSQAADSPQYLFESVVSRSMPVNPRYSLGGVSRLLEESKLLAENKTEDFYSVQPSETKPLLKRREELPAGLNELSADKESFSTFSLHVSDVSFKLAQSALAQGQWPEASQIRIEEFVNAFDYHDPLPSSREKVACQIEQAIHPYIQQRNILRASLRTAASGRNAQTPLHLTLLLDNSGSMERPDRKQALLSALETLSQQLTDNDQITALSFANTPRLLVDKLPGSQSQQLVQQVANLPSEGGTNIELALKVAQEKALEQQIPNGQNRLVLLTDGAVNLGEADPASLSRLVTEIRESGNSFDAAGISTQDLNDEVLEALTRQGDGRYYVLDSAEDVDAGFAQQLAGALRPSAKNVKVQVEFNPDRVGQYKLLGFEKHRLNKEDFRNDKVDAAEMAAEEAGVAVYQYEVKPEGSGDVGNLSVRFQDMATGQMVEKRWPIPYEANAPRLELANPALQTATAAALFAAKLRGEPLGESVDLGDLATLVNKLPESYRSMPRVQQLQAMIQQARELSGSE
ncbi:MAG: von Willebrand factor type A domain-containing protein [Planctomycetales bacterium]|nr:von Willebrand factor type A domain-containing protein [Planctomycetales bacterium]